MQAAESMSQSAPTPNAVAYAVGSPKDTFTADIIPPVTAGPRICGSTIEMRQIPMSFPAASALGSTFRASAQSTA